MSTTPIYTSNIISISINNRQIHISKAFLGYLRHHSPLFLDSTYPVTDRAGQSVRKSDFHSVSVSEPSQSVLMTLWWLTQHGGQHGGGHGGRNGGGQGGHKKKWLTWLPTEKSSQHGVGHGVVADMELDQVADTEVGMVADMEVDMVADINVNIQFGERVGQGGWLLGPKLF